MYAAQLGSLIEVVNRFGSYFYGSILGVFILATGFKRATANGAFVGLLAGMTCVGLRGDLYQGRLSLAQRYRCRGGVMVGLLVSAVDPGRKGADRGPVI